MLRVESGAVTDGLVDRFDIGEFRDKLVKDVSGGQRRRVDLAASLVVPPKLLVLCSWRPGASRTLRCWRSWRRRCRLGR